MTINDSVHPTYVNNLAKWDKYRSTMDGGWDFVHKYLIKFSKKEDDEAFRARRAITYCPAHAKAALTDIKNAIYQRMVDITRTDGPQSYQDAVVGDVDKKGHSMNSFIGGEIIRELVGMSAIGVFVDRKPLPIGASRADTITNRPYLYPYKIEDIRNWAYDDDGNLSAVLLRDNNYDYDEETGLPGDETVETYRLLRRNVAEGNVTATIYDENGDEKTVTPLALQTIPFVIFSINHSLLIDVADYQIALANLASADVNFCLKANFPFLVEQFNGAAEQMNIRQPMVGPENEVDADGNPLPPNESRNKQGLLGVEHGRRYGMGLDAPQFIHPSPEPLTASMEKQTKMEMEIRQLVNLALTNVEPRRASADSKKEDRASKEEGLSYIGQALELGEREIARIWSEYEGSKKVATVKYPNNYSLRSDDDRRAEATELSKLIGQVPSITYQKEIAKSMVDITIGHKISAERIATIHSEIENAEVIVTDYEVLASDHEAGFVGTELASRARLYPKGEAEKAAEDHAERARRVALAQASVRPAGPEGAGENAGARGVDDLAADPKVQAKAEKKQNKINQGDV